MKPLGIAEGTLEYLKYITILYCQFYHPSMDHWSILWPDKQPANRALLYTYIDVDNDPIIYVLQAWIKCGANEPAPTYPATGVVDHRPTEVIPDDLRPMSSDVWSHIVRAGVEGACMKYLSAYQKSASVHVEAAHTPSDERIRQFKRLEQQFCGELTWRQVSECLGWGLTVHFQSTIKAITEALMQSPNRSGGAIETSMWYRKHGNTNVWKVQMCFREMRIAAVFISRLKAGGANMMFLGQEGSNMKLWLWAPLHPVQVLSS
jgi:hypothetical protein